MITPLSSQSLFDLKMNLSTGIYFKILTWPSIPNTKNEKCLLLPQVIKTILGKDHFSTETLLNIQKSTSVLGGVGWLRVIWLLVQKLPFIRGTAASNPSLFELPALLRGLLGTHTKPRLLPAAWNHGRFLFHLAHPFCLLVLFFFNSRLCL